MLMCRSNHHRRLCVSPSYSCCPHTALSLQKSPQTESCTDSGAENEGSCHSDQMSNDFSTDDAVDEGICLDSAASTERVLKPKVSPDCNPPLPAC